MINFKTKYDIIGKTLYQPKSEKPSLTDESYKQECDIDFIISNFVQRGIEPPEHQVDYGKQYTSDDFIHSMEVVADVKSAYECLPAIEKERFNNSVTNYLDFISNPSNLKESFEKGYINPDSVDLSDIYPERFKKDTTTVTQTYNQSHSSVNVKTVDVLTGDESLSSAVSQTSNPTQNTNSKSAE